jgi:hypothetical protein
LQPHQPPQWNGAITSGTLLLQLARRIAGDTLRSLQARARTRG